jgi:hypothetical protein
MLAEYKGDMPVASVDVLENLVKDLIFLDEIIYLHAFHLALKPERPS